MRPSEDTQPSAEMTQRHLSLALTKVVDGLSI